MKRQLIVSFTAISIICLISSVSFSKELETVENPQYSDVNKKILNIGNAYYHHIEKGDTIWGTLMVDNNVDPNHYEYYLKELLKLNPKIKDPNLIYEGDDLLVPFIPEEHRRKGENPWKDLKRKRAEKEEVEIARVIKRGRQKTGPNVKKEQPNNARVKPSSELKKEDKPGKRSPKTRMIEIKPPEPKPSALPKMAGVKQKPESKKDPEGKGKKTLEAKSAGSEKKPGEDKSLGREGGLGSDSKARGLGTGLSSATGTVVIGNTLVNAIKTISDKVETKGTLYLPLKGKKPLKLDRSAFPVVYSGEKKIVLDYGNKIEKKDEESIKGRFEYFDFVDIDKKDTDKTIFGKVLKATGFYSVRENREIKVGMNVKLVVRYDWLIEKDKNSFLNSDVKIVKVKVSDDDKVQGYIKEFLEKAGFFLSELKVSDKDSKRTIKKKSGDITSFGSPKDTKEAIKKLLTVLGIKFREKAALKQSESDDVFLYADFYFEYDEKPHVINTIPSTKENEDVAREYDIRLLGLDSKDKQADNMEKVLKLLKKDFRYGTFRLLGDKGEKPFLDVETKGFLIGKNALKISSTTGNYYETLPVDDNNIFITNYKFPKTLKRLVTDHGYKVVEK